MDLPYTAEHIEFHDGARQFLTGNWHRECSRDAEFVDTAGLATVRAGWEIAAA
jgi:hypothetical protein